MYHKHIIVLQYDYVAVQKNKAYADKKYILQKIYINFENIW